MSFRNHKFSPPAPAVQPVVEQSLKSSVIDGVDTFTRVDVDASSKPPLPSMDEYRLSALLSSGAPLNYVNSKVFDDIDADADAFVNKILASDVPPAADVPPAPDSLSND